MTTNVPNAMLLESDFGSHCCFYNIKGKPWTDSIVSDYLKHMYEQSQQTKP